MISTAATSSPVFTANNTPAVAQHFRREGTVPLFFATFFLGIGLMAISAKDFPITWPSGTIGLILAVSSFGIYAFLKDHELAFCCLLLADWLVVTLLAVFVLPSLPALCLLCLPVLLATVFVNWKVGLVVGMGVSLGLFYLASILPGQDFRTAVEIALVSIWSAFFLGCLVVYILQELVAWSWQSYYHGQRELQQAREHQGELSQVVKDLAEANTQMAYLNRTLDAERQRAEDAEQVKAEFTANVSHELRTPLNMIIGFSELILNAPATYGIHLPAPLLADIAAIHRNSQHLTNLINDVLDISQVEAHRMTLNRTWISLPEIIEEAATAVRPLFESRGLYLKTEQWPDAPAVYCDRTRIRQVLLNLLSNAARFTETGGITIEVAWDERRMTITVKDTGAGIADADLHKLFEPFRQIDSSAPRKRGESGLGLNISRRFVELHGGQMGVTSQPRVGSNFWFSLPTKRDEQNPNPYNRWASTDWEPRPHSKLTPKPRLIPRVIIVEPHNVLQDAVIRYLDDVQVEAVAEPSAANALLAAGPAHMVLVRGESAEQSVGWSAAIHGSRYPAPVITCSLPVPSLNKKLGIEDYLMKPIEGIQLLKAIERLGKPINSILIVDDDREALQLFARVLMAHPHHYRVLQASSGPEGLDLLRSRRPDLLLLDIVMPEMDGFAVLRVKNSDPALRDIPVLILSSSDPSGQPSIVPAFSVSRIGGVSTVELLRCALAVGDVLSISHPSPDSARPEAPGG